MEVGTSQNVVEEFEVGKIIMQRLLGDRVLRIMEGVLKGELAKKEEHQ